jgi:hypothetical protein
MKAKKKQPSMQIKRPSLKGMKNTKYLGHFAQDGYIQKGHNLSGIFDIYRQPSAIEMMAPSNPFDAAAERKRREAEVNLGAQAVEAATPDTSAEMAALQEQKMRLESKRGKYGSTLMEDMQLAELPRKIQAATERSREATVGRYRTSRKKFIEEV